METKNSMIESTLKEYDAGGCTRRSFLKKLGALGVAAAVAKCRGNFSPRCARSVCGQFRGLKSVPGSWQKSLQPKLPRRN